LARAVRPHERWTEEGSFWSWLEVASEAAEVVAEKKYECAGQLLEERASKSFMIRPGPRGVPALLKVDAGSMILSASAQRTRACDAREIGPAGCLIDRMLGVTTEQSRQGRTICHLGCRPARLSALAAGAE